MYQQPSGGRGNRPSSSTTRNDPRGSRTSLAGRESATKVNAESKPLWKSGLTQCKITDDWEKQIYRPYNPSTHVGGIENGQAPDRISQNQLSRSIYTPSVKRSGQSFQERIIYPTKRGNSYKTPGQSQKDVLSQGRQPSNSRLSLDRRQSKKSLTQQQYLEQSNSITLEQANDANKQHFDSTPQLIGRKRSSSGRLRGNRLVDEYQEGGYPHNGATGVGSFYTRRGRKRSQKSGMSIRDECDDTQGFFDDIECEPPKVFKTPYLPMLFPNPSYVPSNLPLAPSQSPPFPRDPPLLPQPPPRDPVTPNDRSRRVQKRIPVPPQQSFVKHPPANNSPSEFCPDDDLDDFIPPRPPAHPVEPQEDDDCEIFEQYEKRDNKYNNKYESFRPERASLAATSVAPQRGSTRFSIAQSRTQPQQFMSEATQLSGQDCIPNLESQIASIAQACIPGMLSSIFQLQAPNSTFLRPELGPSQGYLQSLQRQPQILGGVRLSDGFGLSPGLGAGLGIGLGMSHSVGIPSTPGFSKFSMGPPLNYSTTTTNGNGNGNCDGQQQQQQPSYFFRDTFDKNCQQQQIPLYRTVEFAENEQQQQQQIPLLKTVDVERKGQQQQQQSAVFLTRDGGGNNGQPQILQLKMVGTDKNCPSQIPLYQTSDGLASIYPSGQLYTPNLIYPPPLLNVPGRREQQQQQQQQPQQQSLQNYLDTQTHGGTGSLENKFKNQNFSDFQESELEKARGNANIINNCKKIPRKPVNKPCTRKLPGLKSKFQICDANELYKQIQQLNNEQKSTAHTCNCCCKPRKCYRNVSAQKIEKLRKFLCKMKENECDGLEIRGTQLNCCFPSITKLDSRRELKIPGTKLFNEREMCFMKKLCCESKARCACASLTKPEIKEDCCEALLNCLCPAKRESEHVPTKNCKKGKISTTNHNKYGYPTKNSLRDQELADQGNAEDENEDEGEEEDDQTKKPTTLDPTNTSTQTSQDTSSQPNPESQNVNVTNNSATASPDSNETQTQTNWETSELKPFRPPSHSIKPTLGIAHPIKTSWKPAEKGGKGN